MNAESTTLVFNPELTADDWDRNPKFVTYPLIKYRKIIVKIILLINAIIMYFTSLVFKNAFADSLKDSLSDKSLSKHCKLFTLRIFNFYRFFFIIRKSKLLQKRFTNQ